MRDRLLLFFEMKAGFPLAGASFFALLDDIAGILDDVAAMTKVAAKKTAGVLGDDLALNAQQVSGVNADRELPVVWAVAKGSFRNKLILVPAALLISAIIPWAITPLLMLGGMFLCFEGFEKIWHSLTHAAEADNAGHADAEDENAALLQAAASDEGRRRFEQQKVKGAITTDFILSAEIIAIALGTVAAYSLTVQFSVLAAVAIVMTVGVYGIVAVIVKLDDGGLYLARIPGNSLPVRVLHKAGYGILMAAPYLMRSLTVIGTVAMFMVGGGIVAHGLHFVSVAMLDLTASLTLMGSMGSVLTALMPMFLNALFGVLVGMVVFVVVSALGQIKKRLF